MANHSRRFLILFYIRHVNSFLQFDENKKVILKKKLYVNILVSTWLWDLVFPLFVNVTNSNLDLRDAERDLTLTNKMCDVLRYDCWVIWIINHTCRHGALSACWRAGSVNTGFVFSSFQTVWPDEVFVKRPWPGLSVHVLPSFHLHVKQTEIPHFLESSVLLI